MEMIMEKIIQSMLETSISQSQQIKALCNSIEILADKIRSLHERIKIPESESDHNSHN